MFVFAEWSPHEDLLTDMCIAAIVVVLFICYYRVTVIRPVTAVLFVYPNIFLFLIYYRNIISQT